MELVKNKASGKFFVLIDDTGGLDFLVISPEGKVRRLERHLFDSPKWVDPAEALLKQHVTETQVDIYSEFSGESRHR